MSKLPKSALIDGKSHHVISITEANQNSAHSHRVRFGCGLAFDARGAEPFGERERWDVPGEPCSRCAAVAAGHEAPNVPPTIGPTNTVLADVPTGLKCPIDGCAGEVMIRRKNNEAACSARGHAYEIPAVLANALRMMERLAKGDVHRAPGEKVS